MNHNDIRVSIDPAHLQRLIPFVAVHDIRYYLNGVCVEKAKDGGVYLIATDGHTMGVIYDASGTIEGAESVIFRVGPGLGAASKSAASKLHRGLKYRLLVQGQRVKVACTFNSEGDAELFVQAGNSLIEGKFPNWRKVIPDFSKLKIGFGDHMNARYLARLAKIATDKRFEGVSLWQAEPNKAVVARVPKVPEMIIVIMPVYGESSDAALAFKGFPIEKMPEQLPELEAA